MTAKSEPSLEKATLLQDELPYEQAERHFQEVKALLSKEQDCKQAINQYL